MEIGIFGEGVHACYKAPRGPTCGPRRVASIYGSPPRLAGGPIGMPPWGQCVGRSNLPGSPGRSDRSHSCCVAGLAHGGWRWFEALSAFGHLGWISLSFLGAMVSMANLSCTRGKAAAVTVKGSKDPVRGRKRNPAGQRPEQRSGLARPLGFPLRIGSGSSELRVLETAQAAGCRDQGSSCYTYISLRPRRRAWNGGTGRTNGAMSVAYLDEHQNLKQAFAGSST